MSPRKKAPVTIYDEDDSLEQSNQELLDAIQPDKPPTGLINRLDFQLAYPSRWLNRVAVVALVGALITIIITVLFLQSWVGFLLGFVIIPALVISPTFPLFLKAGQYYVVTDFQYRIDHVIVGKWRFFRPYKCVLLVQKSTKEIKVDFAHIHDISTIYGAKVGMVGEASFNYIPSLFNFDDLSPEEKQQAWNDVLLKGRSKKNIRENILIKVRSGIQTFLAGLDDDDLRVAAVLMLEKFVEQYLIEYKHTLGVVVREMTINGELPQKVVEAHATKWASKDNAEAKLAEMNAYFRTFGVEPTLEDGSRYLLLTRGNIRARPSGNFNSLLGDGKSKTLPIISKPETPLLPPSPYNPPPNMLPSGGGVSAIPPPKSTTQEAEIVSSDDTPDPSDERPHSKGGLFGRLRKNTKPVDAPEDGIEDVPEAQPGNVTKPKTKTDEPFGPY
jgi:hypothetical protein